MIQDFQPEIQKELNITSIHVLVVLTLMIGNKMEDPGRATAGNLGKVCGRMTVVLFVGVQTSGSKIKLHASILKRRLIIGCDCTEYPLKNMQIQ